MIHRQVPGANLMIKLVVGILVRVAALQPIRGHKIRVDCQVPQISGHPRDSWWSGSVRPAADRK